MSELEPGAGGRRRATPVLGARLLGPPRPGNNDTCNDNNTRKLNKTDPGRFRVISSHGSARAGRAGSHCCRFRIFMVLLEKSPLARQSGDRRCFHQASLSQLLLAPHFVPAPTPSPGHPGAAGCPWGQPGSCSLQILWDSRPGAG